MSRTRSLFSLLILAGLVAGLFPGFLGAREIAPQESLPTGDVVVRLYYETQEKLNAIAARHDVWQVHKDQGYAVVKLSPAEYQVLLDQGYGMEIDPKQTDLVRHPESIPGYPCYRTVEETYTSLQDLHTAYPHLVDLTDIGDSWEKVTPGGLDGYDLWMIRITNESITGAKPRFMLIAEIHARELATAELAMRVIEYILERYGTDPEITYFVDYHELYVVPMANPDGRKHAETGDWWRKNTDNDDGCGDPGSWGVDLNRNYAFKWGCCNGSSPYPCDETYRGPGRYPPQVEPETLAIEGVVLNLFPDQNGPNGDDEVPGAAPADATGIFITLHSAAALILWPWGWTSSDAPNGPALQAIGTKLATYNGYTPQQSNDLYTTDGTTDDWTYGKLGLASFTYELAGQFFQPCSSFENTDVPDNRASLLYAWKIAETPYMTVYGPDARNAAAAPAAAAPGTPVQLTATINDAQNGGQNAAAAEYYLLPLHSPDPPGDPGTGTAMQPADGSFNSPNEGVVAAIDTAGLAPGAYLLAVRGQDSQGNWGPFGAAFLYIVDPAVSPVIEGHVRDSATNAPLDAAVTAGIFGAATNPATGYYSMTVVSGTYNMTAAASGHAPVSVPGVAAHDYQHVQQDFFLAPICEVFADDVESGPNGWTTGGSPNNWAITTEDAHSPSHSWTDSPGANYPNSANTWLLSPAIDVSGYGGITLNFWQKYQTEAGYDYAHVEYSTNGGSSWTIAASYDGSSGADWIEANLAVPALADQSNVRLRFRLTSDYYATADGWHLDDIRLIADTGCETPLAPTAGFSSNSPVFLGSPVVFANETVGSQPMEYAWDFGDGIGASTERDPQYTYASIGTFTVTLAATNSLGSDSVSHPVVVEQPPCHGLSSITVAGPTGGLPGVYTLTTSYTPPNADPPIAYLWDNGDTVSTTVRTLGVGVFTVAVTATNCVTTTVSDVHTITITAPCTEVTGVDLSRLTPDPLYPGTAVQFSADLAPDDAARPYSYTLTVDGAAGPPQSGVDDPAVFTLTWDVTGTHTVAFAAWNCAMTVPAADLVTVTVEPRPVGCVELTGAAIQGAAAGTPGLYTFTVAYEPVSATLPIAYLWDDGGTTGASTRLLSVGTYTLVVTATNCVDVRVVDDHVITIAAPPTYWYVYLPLLSRSQFLFVVGALAP